TINPFAFISVIFIYITSTYLSSIRWRLLLPEEFKEKRLFSFCLVGSFFNTFLPGIIGGDVVKTFYLYRETNKGSLSFASVFMDRYIGFISLMTIALISFAAGFKYIKGSLIEWLLPTIVFSFLIGSFAIFRLRLGKGIRALSEFYGYFSGYSSQKMVIMKALMLSFTIQILSILSMYIIALGLGQHIYLAYFFIFFPIIVTISTLPISISGIGVREGAFVVLFGMAGVKPEMATAMSFAWFLSTASGGLVGLFEYLRLKNNRKDGY
ncbi:MAG: lysylphosphatidylglycerol synthase transmembrane domain-containing protein, partial [Thermodesulfovibrionales bacterium]|nr:lysylphosphatidylglycerol synthase transmembrane domain-containing protein [Thermodesulfovibrionales bacterium]